MTQEKGEVPVMLALKGYFNGKEFVPLEKVNIKANQKVIITVLDEYIDTLTKKEKPYKKYVGKLSTTSYNELVEALKETEKVDLNEW
jgi:hypothetical protein